MESVKPFLSLEAQKTLCKQHFFHSTKDTIKDLTNVALDLIGFGKNGDREGLSSERWERENERYNIAFCYGLHNMGNLD